MAHCPSVSPSALLCRFCTRGTRCAHTASAELWMDPVLSPRSGATSWQTSSVRRCACHRLPYTHLCQHAPGVGTRVGVGVVGRLPPGWVSGRRAGYHTLSRTKWGVAVGASDGSVAAGDGSSAAGANHANGASDEGADLSQHRRGRPASRVARDGGAAAKFRRRLCGRRQPRADRRARPRATRRQRGRRAAWDAGACRPAEGSGCAWTPPSERPTEMPPAAAALAALPPSRPSRARRGGVSGRRWRPVEALGRLCAGDEASERRPARMVRRRLSSPR